MNVLSIQSLMHELPEEPLVHAFLDSCLGPGHESRGGWGGLLYGVGPQAPLALGIVWAWATGPTSLGSKPRDTLYNPALIPDLLPRSRCLWAQSGPKELK